MIHKLVKTAVIYLLVILMILFACSIRDEWNNWRMGFSVVEPMITEATNDESESKLVVEYTSLDVPNINSSFKTYMDYRSITAKSSPQYEFIHTWGWADENGFMRCDAEVDLGVADDYYLMALGSYYGTAIGTKYKITLDTGRVLYGVLADCKADKHTNQTNQYSVGNNDIIEFLVDRKKLNGDVRYHGSANVYMPLNGSVAKIERMNFVMK